MAQPFSPNDIAHYGENVYKQMHGLFATGTIPGIRDESVEGGFVGMYLDEIYAARYPFQGIIPSPRKIPICCAS